MCILKMPFNDKAIPYMDRESNLACRDFLNTITTECMLLDISSTIQHDTKLYSLISLPYYRVQNVNS